MISKKSVFFIGLLISSLFSGLLYGQKVKPAKGSFGVDIKNKIIVWHTDTLQFTNQSTNNTTRKLRFGSTYELVDKLGTLSYTTPIKIKKKKDTFLLYITPLPLVKIRVNERLNKSTKVPARISYFYKKDYLKSTLGIEFRGNLSLSYPKKTFDLEFWTDSIHEKSRDVKFKALRNDDDWILDGLYNEPLRIRSYIANTLWKAIHQPSYLMQEPEAKSGIGLEYVEVFKNELYLGLFSLSESVDRKLLALKKNDGTSIRGELFKASSYEGAPAFKKAPEYNNLFPHWAGFEMQYPVLDYRSHWDDLAVFVDLVVNSSDTDFALTIKKHIDIDTVIDYYLFVNLLRATDNLGKNYYLARYDKASPYFFVPWDLDGVMGIIQDGKRIATTNDILSNGLFDRLLEVDPDGYREKLKRRWQQLREGDCSDISLFQKVNEQYSFLKKYKVYEREQRIWPNTNTLEEDYDYLTTWLRQRVLFLDAHFKKL